MQLPFHHPAIATGGIKKAILNSGRQGINGSLMTGKTGCYCFAFHRNKGKQADRPIF
jgi:hypothetical protein